MIDNLTVLLCQKGYGASKTFSSEGVKSYSSGMFFEHLSIPVSDLSSLAQALASLAEVPNAFVVRGQVREGSPALIRKTYREKVGRPAYLDPCAREWVMFDLDKGGPPVEAGDFARAIRTWKASLPEGLKEASCLFALSSSSHLSQNLRGHAWFWLDRPYADSELKNFAKRLNLDSSLYQPSQPHYTADPVFVGSSDPLPERSFLVRGLKEYGTIACPGGVRLRELGEKRLLDGERQIRKDVSENKPKHPTVNRVAYHLGKLCPHILSQSEVFERLSAASKNPERDMSEDVRQGLEDGMKEPELSGEDWRGLLAYAGKDYKPAGTVANAVVILRNDLRLEGLFAFDTRKHSILLTRSAPFDRGNNPGEGLEDTDAVHLSLFLQTEYDLLIREQDAYKAIEAVARDNRFDPVVDYLEDLEWDGTPRLATMARDLLGTKEAYESSTLRLALISLVKRAYEPGCKSDHTIILEGAGGVGKTTFLEWLGGEWYCPISDQIGKGKDAIGAIHSAWLADFSEMSAMKRGDAEAIKDFLTTREDLVRLPYERRHKKMPRRCGFFATMNPDALRSYIVDSAMARRIWPIDVIDVKTSLLTTELRDQILAEACWAYKAGETSWRLSDEGEVIGLAEARQDRSEDEQDPWLGPTVEYLRGRERCQVWEVLDGIQIRREDHLRYSKRMGNLLSHLGWVPARMRVGSSRTRVWDCPTGWLESYPRTGHTTLTQVLGPGLTVG